MVARAKNLDILVARRRRTVIKDESLDEIQVEGESIDKCTPGMD